MWHLHQHHALAVQLSEKRDFIYRQEVNKLGADAHLATSRYCEGNGVRRKRLPEALNRSVNSCGAILVYPDMNMRGHHSVSDAVCHGGARQRERLGQRLRAVVNAGQIVAVQVDHRTGVSVQPRARGRARASSRVRRMAQPLAP